MKVLNVLSACILLTFFAHFGQCCGPAEIGQNYTITSTTTVPSNAALVWELFTNNNAIALYDTSKNDPNKTVYPDTYVGSRTQLTILSVTKNDGNGQFQQLVQGSIVYTCKLPVYKRASTPTCESVTLAGNLTKTTCTTAEVFPRAKCQFTLTNGGIDKRDISDGTSYITYTHTDPKSDETYYSTSCTLQYPVDGLKPGKWLVQVNMYPDLKGVSLAQGATGQADNTLQLSIPTVNIDHITCPKGLAGEGNINVRNNYIRQGEKASCQCTRAHAGNPRGTVRWSSTQGGTFTQLSETADAVTIQIDSPDIFTCQSISALNGSNSKTYTPKYAYGPNSASLTFQRPGPIYLCPNQQTNIGITCQVPKNSFNPTTLFTIRDTDSNHLAIKVAGDTEQSKSVNYNFTKSGQHTFTCRVENAIFNDIIIDAPASAIEAYAPPKGPPSVQVTGQSVNTYNSETWVKRGSIISVSCSAEEAYPLVTSKNITCGSETSSSSPLNTTVRSDDELVCQCAVNHETKTPCNGFNLNKDMTIQIAYGPTEVTISLTDDQFKELSNDYLNMCSAEGLDLTVVCAVKQLDVRPALTTHSFTWTIPIGFTNKQTYLDQSGGEDYRSVKKLKVTSGGSHSLVCGARNPSFKEIELKRTMIVEVREPPSEAPKIYSRSSQNGDILVEGDDVTVTCDVLGGYPTVQSITLICGQNQSVTSNETSASLTLTEIKPSYNETNCTCQATHVTECYDLIGSHTLIVMRSNQTRIPQEESPSIGAAVGGAIGAFFVVAVVVGGIFFTRRRMKKKEHPRADDEVFIENVVYGTPVQDYTAIKTTIESATAPPKNYNPESLPAEKEDNPYENVKLDRKSLVKASSKTKPALAAKPKYPGTSVKTKAVQKSSEKDQNNPSGETEYTTVDKTKTEHSQSSDHDQISDITSAGPSGEIPEIPDRHYNPEEIKDSVNEPSTSKPSKGNKKNIKEKTTKKEKEKKDKKEKKKKGKNKDEDHVYSNKAFDQSGDGEVYANIGASMKSSTDVDDGMHKNKDGLMYTTIVGVGSLKGAQRPVHHPRKEASVDYADIDFNKIVANREDLD